MIGQYQQKKNHFWRVASFKKGIISGAACIVKEPEPAG